MQTLNHRLQSGRLKVLGSASVFFFSAMELLNPAPNKNLKNGTVTVFPHLAFKLFNFLQRKSIYFYPLPRSLHLSKSIVQSWITFRPWSNMTSYTVLPICILSLRQRTNPHKLAAGRSSLCLNYNFGWCAILNICQWQVGCPGVYRDARCVSWGMCWVAKQGKPRNERPMRSSRPGMAAHLSYKSKLLQAFFLPN